MFGLHMPELIIILVVALLIFGPKKLPEMGASVGKSIKEFRKGMAEMSQPKDEEGDEDAPQKTPKAEVVQRELPTKSVSSDSDMRPVFGDVESVGHKVNSEVGSTEARLD